MEAQKTNSLYMIGNAHLDPAWMWRLDEGYEAFLATCRSALARMQETDEFIFTASSAAHYEFVEQIDPELFLKIKDAVKKGKWSLSGGWWVESDCNLPGGEAFIRQGLYGQKYFQSRFGIQCKTGYCIDSFGHNANLPQLLQHCGLSRYVFMRPEEHEKPLQDALFTWRSTSGNEVIAYRIPLHYSSHQHSIKEKLEKVKSYPLYKDGHPWMIFYGVGNHGGGPTKEQIAQILSEQKFNKDFNIEFGNCDAFFAEVERNSNRLAVITDEMQPHAIGCYSAHSEIKKLNRFLENSLLRAEKFCIMAEINTNYFKANWENIKQGWKNLLLNNFHDILGGVAIKEACDDAIALYYEGLSIARREERNAIQAISNNIDTQNSIESLLLFNPHPWKILTPVEFELWHPDASEKGNELKSIVLIGSTGENIISQKVESSGKIGSDRVRFVAQTELPAFGWTKVTIDRNSQQAKIKSSLKSSENELSNAICGIIFEGEAKGHHIKYLPAQVLADQSDTWGHGITGFTEKKGIFKVEKVTVLERGPVRGRVRVESSYGNSRMEEDFILYEGSDYIEQRVFLDWRKTNSVLKLRYAHGCKSPQVFYDIPYSVLERPLGSEEVPGGSWVFMQDEVRGIGIINDAKSSYSSDENFITITVARSPLYAHHAPPHVPIQNETKRYLDQGEQEFIVRILPCQKSWQDAPMPTRALEFLQPPIVHIESGHTGNLQEKTEGFSVDKSNILISVIKRSHDDKSDQIIIRALEVSSLETRASFSFEAISAKWDAVFSPHELKSFLIDDSKILEINGLENDH
jgi:alpha-mannosidase